MRILTNSLFEDKGLISIFEAGDHIPQIVFFCIPIDKRDAKSIISIYDFQEYFSQGISTKIRDGNNINTVSLDYEAPSSSGRKMNRTPKFVVSIRGHKIDFYLSTLNFKAKSINQIIDISFYYSGNYLYNDLSNKLLIIVEPNWMQLDKLFLEERIVFTDWK